jgi:hypothetical protein
MRTPLIALLAASLLPACQGSVTDAAQAATTSSSAASTGSTSSSSGGAGGAGAATCTFTVSGAIDTTVVSDPSFVTVLLGGTLECGDLGNGFSDSVLLSFGPPHGPGSYDTLTDTGYVPLYQRAGCPASGAGCTDIENFGDTPASTGCTVDLTVAPTKEKADDPIAGTFSCPKLVDDADPTRIVSVSGSFSALMHVPPD